MDSKSIPEVVELEGDELDTLDSLAMCMCTPIIIVHRPVPTTPAIDDGSNV